MWRENQSLKTDQPGDDAADAQTREDQLRRANIDLVRYSPVALTESSSWTSQLLLPSKEMKDYQPGRTDGHGGAASKRKVRDVQRFFDKLLGRGGREEEVTSGVAEHWQNELAPEA
jgi:hypothetical protein